MFGYFLAGVIVGFVFGFMFVFAQISMGKLSFRQVSPDDLAKTVEKILADRAIFHHNQTETGTNPVEDTTKPEKRDVYNPEEAEDQAKQRLDDLAAQIEAINSQPGQTLDTFDQLSILQRKYAEEYYKKNRKMPPGYEGL